MHNGFNQIYNMTPKENSKAHKAKEANKRKYEKVVCAKCGATNVTLYKTFLVHIDVLSVKILVNLDKKMKILEKLKILWYNIYTKLRERKKLKNVSCAPR